MKCQDCADCALCAVGLYRSPSSNHAFAANPFYSVAEVILWTALGR
jgi:hypothetical protein